MNMPKYTIITVFLLASLALTAYAQVNESEIQNLPPVSFISYEGPHTRVDTREQIRQIGVVLGQQITSGEGNRMPALGGTEDERTAYSYLYSTGAQNRYYIIHSVSTPDGNKLDADIMGLGVDVAVDHIRNLRVILQGYLQAAYNYSAPDALLLAEFITIYNAVYRGHWDYFTGRYKNPVLERLSRERAGLSIRYDEWPGRTLIVIPLGHGGLSSIDTTVISDARVIEELRKEDDQGIPQMQQLVDLMERQAEEAEQQAQVVREEIRQEERQIAEERSQIAEERQQIQEERQQIQEQQQQGTITQAEAREAEQQLEQREEAVTQREEAVEEREEAIEERREIAQALEEFAEERAEDAQVIRETVAAIQQEGIENPPQAVNVTAEISGGVYGVSIDRTSPVIMGQIIRFNPADGRILGRSTNNTIHTRSAIFVGGRIFAISGEPQRGISLVEINPDTLDAKFGADTNIRAGSMLWQNGNDLYAILTEDNRCYLGRFNYSLELQGRSMVSVNPDASVIINQGRLLTQRENGSIMALNPATLELIW